MIRPAALLGVVVAGVVVTAGVATAVAPTPRGPGVRPVATVPVRETVVACPGLRSREGYTDSSVAAGTPPQAGSSDAAGAAGRDDVAVVRTLTEDPGKSRTKIILRSPGASGVYTGRNGERDSLVGRAQGTMAPGFTVTQTERTVDGSHRGLATTACLPSSTDFWFVGAGTRIGEQSELILTNPENAVAMVDVSVFGPRGRYDSPAANGITVPARSRVELSIPRLAPAQKVLALHVAVRSGRLSAAITETDVNGFQPRGTDWIPATVAPDRALVIPGVPAVAKDRVGKVVLDIAAPRADAIVSVKMVTPDGTFTPIGGGELDVRSGSVRQVDLTKPLRSEPAALLVTSDQPVTAGVKVVLKRPGYFGDAMYLAATAGLTASAVVPDNIATADLTTRLIISAPTGDAEVQVLTYNANGKQRTITVTVPAGTTRALAVAPPTVAPGEPIKGNRYRRFGMVVTPLAGSAPIYAVRMQDEEGSRGPLVSALPLLAARLTVPLLPAAPTGVAGVYPVSSPR
jgi:hypothetical protein